MKTNARRTGNRRLANITREIKIKRINFFTITFFRTIIKIFSVSLIKWKI